MVASAAAAAHWPAVEAGRRQARGRTAARSPCRNACCFTAPRQPGAGAPAPAARSAAPRRACRGPGPDDGTGSQAGVGGRRERCGSGGGHASCSAPPSSAHPGTWKVAAGTSSWPLAFVRAGQLRRQTYWAGSLAGAVVTCSTAYSSGAAWCRSNSSFSGRMASLCVPGDGRCRGVQRG